MALLSLRGTLFNHPHTTTSNSCVFFCSISLSSQCQSTLLTVASSSDSACLNIGGLAGLLTTSSNSSLVPTVNSWLSGACSQAACTNSSLAAIVQNITSGCGDDLAQFGISNSSGTTDQITQAVQEAYPTVRDIGCLKVDSNNTLCVTDLLDDVESVEGTLSLDNIAALLPQILTGQVSSLPSYITCNDCVKQAFTVLQTDQPSLANQTVEDALTSQCGSDFLSE